MDNFDTVAEKVDSQTNEIGYELIQLNDDIYAKRDVDQFYKRHQEIFRQLRELKTFVVENEEVIKDWGEKQDERLQANS